MSFLDFFKRREHDPAPALCAHHQNPAACLTCYHANPPPPPAPPPEPPKGARIVHMACGCRLSTRGRDAFNLSACAQHASEHVTDAGWFWAQYRDTIGHHDHATGERGECEDERCQKAASRKPSTWKGRADE